MPEAVVLAGRENTGALRTVGDAPYEALLEIGGRSLLSRVLEALRGSEAIGEIRVVAPADLAGALPEGVSLVEAGESLLENVRRGLAAARGERVLLTGSDIPLLQAWMVDRFLAEALPLDADVVYPIVPRAAVERELPGTRRTWVRFREGLFTGGNIFLLRREVALAAAERAGRLLELRKKPWRLAGLLGGWFLLRLGLGRVGLPEVEERFSRLLGVRGRTLVTEMAAIGVDADKPEDFELLAGYLAGRGPSA